MKLSEKEWIVLNTLWDCKEAELGEVVDKLYDQTKWSRNTVHTYLTRMEGKGIVRIDKSVNPHTYSAAVDREKCRKQERKNFLKKVYSNSASDMIVAFLKEDIISQEEIEKLKNIINNMEV